MADGTPRHQGRRTLSLTKNLTKENHMKSIQNILTLVVTVLIMNYPNAYAADGHDHHGKEKAPHNGRLMELDKMHVEFLVEADKTVRVYLYDGELKPMKPSDQTVSLLVQGKDSSKTKTELANKNDSFVSDAAITIPEGAKAVLTVKVGGKPNNLRFDLNMENCGGCKNAEYACSCEH